MPLSVREALPTCDTSVPNGTYSAVTTWQDGPVLLTGETMPKSGVAGAVQQRRVRRRPAELSNTVEGQMAELCRDLAVQAKHLRQLQEQADELHTAIRQWTSRAARSPSRGAQKRPPQP